MCQFGVEDIIIMCSKLENELYQWIAKEKKQMMLINWLNKLQIIVKCMRMSDVVTSYHGFWVTSHCDNTMRKSPPTPTNLHICTSPG
jgi:hypothetical protein